jgi:uncharacterized membrane protein YtjA (UPF0391 family)
MLLTHAKAIRSDGGLDQFSRRSPFPGGMRTIVKETRTMLQWTIIFIIVAVVAELLGLSGVAGEAAWIAHVLFVIFLVLFIISLIFRGRPPAV